MGVFLVLKTFFLTTRLGRIVGIAGLSLALIGGAYAVGHWKGHAAGKQDGKVEGAKDQLESDRAENQQDREAFKSTLNQISTAVAVQAQVIADQASKIQAANARMGQIERERTAQAEATAKLTDPEVLLELAGRLQLRAPSDTTPALYPAEIRKADVIVGDHAKLQEKFTELENKVNAQGETVKAMNETQKLTEQKFQAALTYIGQVETTYAHSYNLFYKVQGVRWWKKIVTFGIAKPKKMPVFEPIVPPARPAELQARP